nr:hypothetical protein [Komagataeibacter intermedius]
MDASCTVSPYSAANCRSRLAISGALQGIFRPVPASTKVIAILRLRLRVEAMR